MANNNNLPKGITYQGKQSYVDPWRQNVDQSDTLQVLLNALQKKRSDENYKSALPSDYLEGYGSDQIDSLILANELMQYLAPKQPEKEEGIMALLQRLLPGGETGRSRDFSKEKSRFNK
jgi:hypothetical protein